MRGLRLQLAVSQRLMSEDWIMLKSTTIGLEIVFFWKSLRIPKQPLMGILNMSNTKWLRGRGSLSLEGWQDKYQWRDSGTVER